MASDIVVGRRVPILLRLLWAQAAAIVAWSVVFIPLILLESWASDIVDWLDAVPLLPLVAALMSAATVIWGASYVYLLYRKIVDDTA
jgi:hypothetical protein